MLNDHKATAEEAVARLLLIHVDTYEDAPLIRCLCGVRNLTVTEHADHVAGVLGRANLLVTPPGITTGGDDQ